MAPRRKKNKYIAAGLAFGLGTLGVHKFYLQKPGQGVFYLMLFFVGLNVFNLPISAFLGLVEAMMLLFMDNERFDQLYNKEYYQQSQSVEKSFKRRGKRPQNKRSHTASRFKKNPFKITAQKKYAEYDVTGAIEDFNQALTIHPDDRDIHYQLAKAYSLNEEKEKCFTHLKKAVSLGFDKIDQIQSEDDFAFLRIQPEFDDFKASGYQSIPLSARPEEPEDENQQPKGLLLDQLNKLAELRNRGLLSEKEFQMEKEKLMR